MRPTLEEGALLHGETLVIDVALDMGHGLQRHAQGSDRTREVAADHDIVGYHIALELGAFRQHKGDARHVPLDVALKLDLAFRRHVANELQVLADRRIAKFARSLLDRMLECVRHLAPVRITPTTADAASCFQPIGRYAARSAFRVWRADDLLPRSEPHRWRYQPVRDGCGRSRSFRSAAESVFYRLGSELMSHAPCVLGLRTTAAR